MQISVAALLMNLSVNLSRFELLAAKPSFQEELRGRKIVSRSYINEILNKSGLIADSEMIELVFSTNNNETLRSVISKVRNF